MLSGQEGVVEAGTTPSGHCGTSLNEVTTHCGGLVWSPSSALTTSRHAGHRRLQSWRLPGNVVTYVVIITVLLSSSVVDCVLTFASQPQNHTTLQGGTIQLLCSVSELDSRQNVVWLQNAQIISMGTRLLNGNSRFFISHLSDDAYDLSIDGVTTDDEGAYTCQVLGQILSQTSRLTVNVPPSIRNYSLEPKRQVASVNGTIQLECVADGKPVPTVTWTREGSILPDGSPSHRGSLFSAHNLGKEDGGVYTCTASNDVGTSISQQFQVQVNYSPEVRSTSGLVHVRLGQEVTLECNFESNPPVTVTWYHNGSIVEEMETPGTIESPYVQSILRIGSVQFKDVGHYLCEGRNDMGQATGHVEINGLPYELMVTGQSEGQYSDQYTLTWSVQSPSQLHEVQINVTQVARLIFVTDSEPSQDDTMVVPSVFLSCVDPTKCDRQFLLTNLSASTEYSARLRAGNSFGFTEWSEEFLFNTAEEGHPGPRHPVTTATTLVTIPAEAHKKSVYISLHGTSNTGSGAISSFRASSIFISMATVLTAFRILRSERH